MNTLIGNKTPLHHCITAPLHRWTTLAQHHCTTPQLHNSTTTLLHNWTTLPFLVPLLQAGGSSETRRNSIERCVPCFLRSLMKPAISLLVIRDLYCEINKSSQLTCNLILCASKLHKFHCKCFRYFTTVRFVVINSRVTLYLQCRTCIP